MALAMRQSRTAMHASRSRVAYTVLALVIVLAATLFPGGSGPGGSPTCLKCAGQEIADIITNVILFLPLGAGLALQRWPARRSVLVAATISAGIECAQLFLPNRDASLSDIFSNTAGALVGLSLVHTAAHWLVPPPRRAAILALGAAGAAAVTFVVSGLLLSPSFPTADYFVEWTPNLLPPEWYRGEVLDATIGGLPIPPGALANSAEVRGQMLADSGMWLRVRMAAGPYRSGLRSILRIEDARGGLILVLGSDRRDLVFHFRAHSADFQLDEPDLRLSDAMQDVSPGDTVEIRVRGRRGRYCFTVNGSGACHLGFTVAMGWALLHYPEALPTGVKALLNLAWMGVLVLLPGYWARRRGIALAAASVAATGLIVAPLVGPVLPSRPAEWVAAALGFALGALAQRAVRGQLRAGSASR